MKYLLLLLLSTVCFAKINVVTTLPSYADIAKNVGGDEVSVTSLTKGNQDPHFVDAKPDLILYLNKADLLVRAGLGLEDGWLPPLLVGSRNGKIQTGSETNLDVSRVIHLLEVPQGPIDRSMGDVHPGGNPHFMVDPRNGVVIAQAIAERLSAIKPEKAAEFQKNADLYIAELKKRILVWAESLKSLKGLPVVTYHKSWTYFFNWTGALDIGTVEPKPGIPPSPEHVVQLIHLMKEKHVKYIFQENFYPKDVAEHVARETGAHLLVLPTEVSAQPIVKTYFDVFDAIVAQLKGK